MYAAAQHEDAASHMRNDLTMNARSALSAIGSFFDVIGSAAAVSRAVELGKAPRAADLRRLGIDPVAFGRVRRG